MNLKKKPVKCYIWSIYLCGAQNWTHRKVDQKYLENYEMCCLRRMKKFSWTDRVTNEEVLHRVKQKRIACITAERIGQLYWSDLAEELPSKQVIEGKIEGNI